MPDFADEEARAAAYRREQDRLPAIRRQKNAGLAGSGAARKAVEDGWKAVKRCPQTPQD